MKQTSASHPRAANCFRATSMPARIFSAVIPGGSAGSEKSTVSGSYPTSRIRVMNPSSNFRLRASPLLLRGASSNPAKFLEDSLLILRRDADPGVAGRHLDGSVHRHGPDLDPAALQCEGRATVERRWHRIVQA